MPQMSVVIDTVEWFLARKDFEWCHFSWENFPYASPRGFSGQLSDMLYAEITWIQRAFAFHLLWHIIRTMELVTMGLTLDLSYLYRSSVCHPSHHPEPTGLLQCFLCTCHAMKLGRGKTYGCGNPILRARELGLAGHQGLDSSWACGMSGNTERMLWTRFECHGSEDPLMQLSGTFFSSLT